MTRRRFEHEWETYFRSVVDIPNLDVRETRRAFYAGGQALLELIGQARVLRIPAPNEEDLKTLIVELLRLEDLKSELEWFARRLADGDV
jgi:hypothetical protein